MTVTAVMAVCIMLNAMVKVYRFKDYVVSHGYLVGDISRWNDGKRAELNDRQYHTQEK